MSLQVEGLLTALLPAEQVRNVEFNFPDNVYEWKEIISGTRWEVPCV